MREQVLQLLPELEKMNNSYIDAIARRFEDYIRYSEVPAGFQSIKLDENKIPHKVKELYEKIFDVVYYKLNIVMNFDNYVDTGYLAAKAIEKYFRHCMISDEILESILYIDTNLLLEDYKRLMDYNKEELSFQPVHSLETLYKNVESAPFVIWDKFTKIKSAYDKGKIYDILSIRQREGLGNIYMIAGGQNALDAEIASVMNMSIAFDCSAEQLYTKNRGGK